jgi:hypothetical protein
MYGFWQSQSATTSPKPAHIYSGTGNLGLEFRQNGAVVQVAKSDNDPAWYYTSQVMLEREPFQVLVPKRHCDQASDEMMVHVIIDTELAAISEKISALRDEKHPFSDIFLPGYAMASQPNFVTELYDDSFDLKQDNPFRRGWNFFYGTRYSGELDGKLLVNVEWLGTETNAINTAENAVLVFGRAECTSGPGFWHIDVVGVQFLR